MNLDNFVCKDITVNGVKFTPKIVTPKGKANTRTLEKLQGINYIVVHNTGNSSPMAGDEAHANYLQNVENADKDYVSWHITVDNDSATQHLPFNEVGYHAGDGKGKGNRQGIGIEIAENKDYPANERNGIKIICALMKQFNIPIDRVLPHRYFSSVKKLCPWRILKSQSTWESNWKAFQSRIAAEYNAIYNKQVKPPEPPQKQVGINSVVTISKGAIYGGLSLTRGKTVPTAQTGGKKHTVVAIATHYGAREARLKEINSWIAIKYLNA